MEYLLYLSLGFNVFFAYRAYQWRQYWKALDALRNKIGEDIDGAPAGDPVTRASY